MATIKERAIQRVGFLDRTVITEELILAIEALERTVAALERAMAEQAHRARFDSTGRDC